MTQHMDQNQQKRFFRFALALILALALPTFALMNWNSADTPENGTTGIEKQERYYAVMTARLHSQQYFPAAVRLPFEHSSFDMLQARSFPLLLVLFYPLIYKRLKRLLLYPLKYTSNYVAFSPGRLNILMTK